MDVHPYSTGKFLLKLLFDNDDDDDDIDFWNDEHPSFHPSNLIVYRIVMKNKSSD